MTGVPKPKRGLNGQQWAEQQLDATGRLLRDIAALGIPTPEREWQFHPVRKWAVDIAWPDLGVCMEIEGGAFVGGHHFRGVGAEEDMRKYRALAVRGYRLLRYSPGAIKRGEHLDDP